MKSVVTALGEKKKNGIYKSCILAAKPSFTIQIHDQFIAKDSDLIWECEAFGIPDVDYEWMRNSEPLKLEELSADDQARYEIVVSIVVFCPSC